MFKTHEVDLGRMEGRFPKVHVYKYSENKMHCRKEIYKTKKSRGKI